MAGISAVSDTAEEATGSLWELVAMIQRATFGLIDEVGNANHDLSSGLDQNLLFQKLVRSTNASSNTVALHPGSDPEQPADRLQQLLQAFEEESPSWIRTSRKHELAFNSLKDSIHRYLRVSLQFKSKQQQVDQLVQRSMYDFAYGLSHEINNPLANISARAADLATTASSERERKSLRTIVDQTMKAHEMLAEMMLAVKTPALNLAPGDLRAFALLVSREWQPRAAERNIGWIPQIGDDFLWSIFDRIALSEAISAGIRNAIEACRSGDTLTFIAERSESSSGELEVRIAIIDNGPGVSSSALDRAWDLYFCGREAGRGLGIGLAKVRRIVESHQGGVWLESKAQHGCGLEIRLPWKRIPSVA
jgi:signal transduction histidine kinase